MLRGGVGGGSDTPTERGQCAPWARLPGPDESALALERHGGEIANYGILRHRYTTTNETADG